MSKIGLNKIFTLCFGLLVIFVLYCEKNATPSLYVENPDSSPNPVINSVVPPGKALAGIGEIVFNGANFSPVMEENFVYFNGISATILSASTTQITVQSPNLPGDSLVVKINVAGSFLFSNTIYYTLEPVIEQHGNVGPVDMYGITADKNENLYYSVSRDGGSTARRIDKVFPDGTVEKGWGGTSFLFSSHMRVGPGDTLYLARNNANTYYIGPSGGNTALLARLSGSIYDFDFNPQGSMYAAGNGDSLYLLQTNGAFQGIADYTDTYVRGVRVFNGYVYVAGTGPGPTEAVWRNQINAVNSLGPKELVIDLTAQLGFATQIQAITFAEDGDMYLCIINTDDPILVVHPDDTFEPLYPGILKPADAINIEIRDMAWGTGVLLYINRFTQFEEADGTTTTVQEIMKLNMLKNSAPYYGREL